MNHHFHWADFLETCTCTLYTYLPLCIVYTSIGILDDNVIIFKRALFFLPLSACLFLRQAYVLVTRDVEL